MLGFLGRGGALGGLLSTATSSSSSTVGFLGGSLFAPSVVGSGGNLSGLGARRWKTKIAGGSKFNIGISRAGKRLGLKRTGGQFVKENELIATQRGQKWHPGANVHMGRNHTLHSSCPGYIKFVTHLLPERPYKKNRTYMCVVPVGSDGSCVKKYQEENYRDYLELRRERAMRLKGVYFRETKYESQRKLALQRLKEQGVKRPEIAIDQFPNNDWKVLIRHKDKKTGKVRPANKGSLRGETDYYRWDDFNENNSTGSRKRWDAKDGDEMFKEFYFEHAGRTLGKAADEKLLIEPKDPKKKKKKRDDWLKVDPWTNELHEIKPPTSVAYKFTPGA